MEGRKGKRMIAVILWSLIAIGPAGAQGWTPDGPYWRWSLSEAVRVLNSSPWARHETFTTVVGGIGSGRAGEKEIYNRFYVRFLSAAPVREAYARILQLEFGYDSLDGEEKLRFDELLRPVVAMETQNWIVLAVSFRSNDPEMESQIRRFFHVQTTATLMDKAFLSTGQFSQIRIHAYFPPAEEGVGARFVFPREVNGTQLVSSGAGQISFELLDVPIVLAGGGTEGGGGRGRGDRGPRGGGGGAPDEARGNATILRATFSSGDMFIDGKPVY